MKYVVLDSQYDLVTCFGEKVKKKRLKPILRATRSTINFQDSALRRYILHAALKMRNLSSHIAPQEEHDIIKDIKVAYLEDPCTG